MYPRYDNLVLRDYLRKKSVKQRSPWQRWGGTDLFGRQWAEQNVISVVGDI